MAIRSLSPSAQHRLCAIGHAVTDLLSTRWYRAPEAASVEPDFSLTLKNICAPGSRTPSSRPGLVVDCALTSTKDERITGPPIVARWCYLLVALAR